MMKITVFHAKTHHFCPSLFIKPSIKHPSSVSIPVQNQQKQVSFRSMGFKLKCGTATGGSVSGLEKKLEDDVVNMEKELMGMGGFKEKCKGISGIVELMECLEREAIMGEDEGKEASDYNRRAKIFNSSSRVFQALKESNSTVS